MRNLRLAVVIAIATILTPLTVIGAATIATRSSGIFFRSLSSNPLPSPGPLPGFYSSNGVMQACNGSTDGGSCYPMASPFPTPSPYNSADAGTNLGSGATEKIDTCATGNTGSTCFRLSDVVNVLKQDGILKP